MASLRRATGGQQGDCSMRPNGSRPKPRLLRSRVTEPSITTQNAIRGSLASPVSQQKAADILSKSWTCAGARVDGGRHMATPELLQQHMVAMIASGEDQGARPSSSHVATAMLETSKSDCYFSFPDFENWSGVPERRIGTLAPNGNDFNREKDCRATCSVCTAAIVSP